MLSVPCCITGRTESQKRATTLPSCSPHSVGHVSYVPFPGLRNKQPQGVNDCLVRRLPKLIPGGMSQEAAAISKSEAFFRAIEDCLHTKH
jgi:hypothetical protein